MNTSLNIVIFSKDRACQLDLLLVSMKKMFAEYRHCTIAVLYTTSGKAFEQGYKILKKSHKNIDFINERDFKKDLLLQIQPENYYTVFFVDDIVWKEPFTVNCDELKLLKNDPDILCLSLRLDSNLTYCYAYDTNMKTPAFDHKRRWYWRDEDGDFGYPMSLDGHIFRTHEIYPLLLNLPYHNPNSLEGTLSIHPLKSKKMICLQKAPIFNIPINKVQKYNTNRHGDVSAEYLNKMFLSGHRILYKPFIGFRNYACHQEVDVTLKNSFFNIIKNLLS
ncbi:hypothetical protein N9112_02545 [bacterium]|nr:hypothetical protein [bacterium]